MSNADSEKAKRLAEALRANLRRRKGQAKDINDTPSPDEEKHD